jgi:glucokinase
MSGVIGIDLGVTRVAAMALGDGERGEPVARATERSDTAALLDQLAGLVDESRGDDLVAVGVAVPRIVEFATGRIVSPARARSGGNGAVDLPLANVPLRNALEERVGVPVFVDNRASVAALAEAHDQQLELVARHLVLLGIGSGVGGGLVLGGRIYRGATGGAGELGHTIVGLDLAGAVPAPMRFPQPGSLEFVASGHALDGLAGQARRIHPKSELARLREEGKPVLGTDVIRAARDGDPSAGRMIEIWGQRIGIGVANAMNAFDPEEVVIGGYAARAGDLLLEPARRVASQYSVPGVGARTTIRLSRHGGRAGLLGAALLAGYETDAAD